MRGRGVAVTSRTSSSFLHVCSPAAPAPLGDRSQDLVCHRDQGHRGLESRPFANPCSGSAESTVESQPQSETSLLRGVGGCSIVAVGLPTSTPEDEN